MPISAFRHPLDEKLIREFLTCARRYHPAYQMLPEPKIIPPPMELAHALDQEDRAAFYLRFPLDGITQAAVIPLLERFGRLLKTSSEAPDIFVEIDKEHPNQLYLRLDGGHAPILRDYIEANQKTPHFQLLLLPKYEPVQLAPPSPPEPQTPPRSRLSDLLQKGLQRIRAVQESTPEPESPLTPEMMEKFGAYMHYLQCAGMIRADRMMEIGLYYNPAVDFREGIAATFGGDILWPYPNPDIIEDRALDNARLKQVGGDRLRSFASQAPIPNHDDYLSMASLTDTLFARQRCLKVEKTSTVRLDDNPTFTSVYLPTEYLPYLDQFLNENPRIMEAYKRHPTKVAVYPDIADPLERIAQHRQGTLARMR